MAITQDIEISPDDLPSTKTIYVAPLSTHTHTMIFLHGREDFGEDLAHCIFDSKASSDGSSLAGLFPSMKWVFPTSKLRYSAQRDFEFGSSSFAESLKGEEIISQWFDVWDIKLPRHKEELMVPGLKESIHQILEVVQDESTHVPLERIILGGISQGCVTALYTLLISRVQLGGFIGLCSWLPFQSTIEEVEWASKSTMEISQQVKKVLGLHGDLYAPSADNSLETMLGALSLHESDEKTPMFLAHSMDDETVPFAQFQGLSENVINLGFDVTLKEYPNGGHWIHPERGVDDMATFIRRVFILP